MSNDTMRERQLAEIRGHAEIQRLIRDNEEVAKLEPWCAVEIHQAVAHLLDLELDLKDRALFAELEAFFNTPLAPEQSLSALERARARWGLEA